MGKDLTDTERAIIQQIILDRWNPLRLHKKIASHFGLTINQVRHIRSMQEALRNLREPRDPSVRIRWMRKSSVGSDGGKV
jgi:DNA-directed RNA polymerase sigma subunit (sigma70/sigma32)